MEKKFSWILPLLNKRVITRVYYELLVIIIRVLNALAVLSLMFVCEGAGEN